MSVAVSGNSSTSTTPNHQSTRYLLGMMPSRPSDREERERAGRIRTLLDLLTTEKMDGLDRATLTRPHHHQPGTTISRWRTLKERLGLKVIGCCGSATWPYGSPPLDVEDENDVVIVELQQRLQDNNSSTNVGRGSRDYHVEEESQSLAAALAAERQFRGGEGDDVATEVGSTTPLRVSLMRLLEETGEREKEKEKELIIEGEAGNDSVCCVCMGRKKGAALIPCGHTYCRVCSREVWLNRGSCPLCNRPILEILDIF